MGRYEVDKLTSLFFTCFDHYFQLNLDETSFLCNEGEIKVIVIKDKPRHYKNCRNSRFSITVLRFRSASGANGTVIFLVKGGNVHPRLKGTKLVTRYGLQELSCVIPKNGAYMDDESVSPWY